MFGVSTTQWAQMALLQGSGCYQVLERLLDCKTQNLQGKPKEARVLFLDLTKA